MNDSSSKGILPVFIHDNYRFRVYIANMLSLLLLIVSQVMCIRTDYKVINL